MIAALVSFHSAFQLRTPIATTSTVSLGMVVLTGLLGRFLHALAPMGVRDRLRDAIARVELELPGMREDLEATIAKRPGPAIPANASLTRSVLAIPAWRKVARERVVALEMLMPHAERRTPTLRRAERALYRAAAAEARADGIAALLRTWRGLHRFFALLMMVAVALHAAVAWHYGYRWIFT